MVTIKEISKLANTSRGTVDRVLNGRGNVNQELAWRILNIAKEYNYKSNPVGRALSNSKKKILIGVVINSVGNQFFDAVLAGMYDTIERYSGYGLSLVVKKIKGYNVKEQLHAVEELLEEDISALVITPMNTLEVVRRLEELSLPIVILNSDVKLENKLAFVGCDYLNSGKLCGDLASLILADGGKVGIVAGSFDMLGHSQRIEGFKQEIQTNPTIQIVSEIENDDDDEISYRVTKEMITSDNLDLIYFCAAGTQGGVQAVIEEGKRIKIVTVDEIDAVTSYLRDGVVSATVTQQPYLQGERMIEILYDYLICGTKPAQVQNYMQNQVKLKSTI